MSADTRRCLWRVLSDARAACRRTWESIPAKFRPLKARLNVVLTRQPQGKENNQAWPEGVLVFNSLETALHALATPEMYQTVERVFVIGGAQVCQPAACSWVQRPVSSMTLACDPQVYKEALATPGCEAVHLTAIEADFDCDAKLDGFQADEWRLWSCKRARHEATRFSIQAWVRPGCDAAELLPQAVQQQHEEVQVGACALPAHVPGYIEDAFALPAGFKGKVCSLQGAL